MSRTHLKNPSKQKAARRAAFFFILYPVFYLLKRSLIRPVPFGDVTRVGTPISLNRCASDSAASFETPEATFTTILSVSVIASSAEMP